MLLSNDIRMLTVGLTIQKMHSTEKYYFKSPRFNAAYGRMTGYHEKQFGCCSTFSYDPTSNKLY